MSFKFTFNHRTAQDYLDGKYGVEALLRSTAESSLSAAQGSAPVDTGAYRSSLHVEVDHTDRMALRVVADVDYALAVEAKTGNLARALGS